MNKYSNHPLAGATDLDSAMNIFWAFYKKYFIALFIISALSAFASTIIRTQIDLSGMTSNTDMNAMIAIYKSHPIPYILLVLVSLVFSVILVVYIIEKPVSEPFNIGDLINKATMAFFPYLATLVLLAIPGLLIISAGMFLLVLPGVFAMFYVVTIGLFLLPVILIESKNPGYALSRSMSLTHHNLWSNIGWVSVAMIMVVIVSLIISALAMLPFSGSFIKSFTDPTAGVELAKNPLYLILASLASALITPVFPILSLILYFRNTGEEKVQEPTTAYEGRVRVEDLYPKMPEDNKQD
jgi:hypothetical protein